MKKFSSLTLSALLATEVLCQETQSQNVIELDIDLFEQLIADKDETKVKDDQQWFIQFDSPWACRPRALCDDVNETWEDLANHQAMKQGRHHQNYETPNSNDFKVARINCARSQSVCHRLGVSGFPTLSIVSGEAIYDYQGALSVESLNSFVTQKQYERISRPRKILHERSPFENL